MHCVYKRANSLTCLFVSSVSIISPWYMYSAVCTDRARLQFAQTSILLYNYIKHKNPSTAIRINECRRRQGTRDSVSRPILDTNSANAQHSVSCAFVCRRSRVVCTPFVFGGRKHKYDIRITPRLVVAFECDHAAFDVSVWDGLPFRVEWKWMHNRGTEENDKSSACLACWQFMPCACVFYFKNQVHGVFFYSAEAAAKASSTGSVHSEVIFVYTICVGFVCT